MSEQVVVRSLYELNGLVEQHVFGHEIEWRLCKRNPDNVQIIEIQSYRCSEDHADIIKYDRAFSYPCYKKRPEYDWWSSVREYSNSLEDAWKIIDYLKQDWYININSKGETGISSNGWQTTVVAGDNSKQNTCVVICVIALAKCGIDVTLVFEEQHAT
jgi:hypothetical protein